VIDMNWLVKFFWADFEAMLAMSLPQQDGGLRRWWGKKVNLKMVALPFKCVAEFDSLLHYHKRGWA
jgi:hypothetical protein